MPPVGRAGFPPAVAAPTAAGIDRPPGPAQHQPVPVSVRHRLKFHPRFGAPGPPGPIFMRTLPLVILTALVLAGPGYATTAAKSPPPPDPLAERMAQAIRLVQKGEFDAALEQYIDPTIAEFEKEYAKRPERIYCARDTVETLLYMTRSAEKNESALAVSAAYASAFYLKGYIFVDRGEFTDAFPYLRKAVELSPSNAQFLSELGHVYQNGKQWPTALETFDRAVEGARLLSDKADHSAELRRALRGRGYSLTELGRLDEAEKVYAECLALDPSDTKATGELEYIKGLRLKPAAAK